MIAYPKNWREAGTEVIALDIEDRLENVLSEIGCKCLAFSGGLDSSLLLYFMCQIYNSIAVFTIGKSNEHLDVVFAKKIIEYYRKRFNVSIEHYIYYPQDWETKGVIFEKFPGDCAVEIFYKFVGTHTNKIITGDGIDEFMCGYYAHMNKPNEKTYYNYLRRLQEEQLVPLDLNSDDVEVYLPYLDEEIITLVSQIPLKDKVNKTSRKKFLVEMAKGKVPDEIIERRKYGFCDALKIKGENSEN